MRVFGQGHLGQRHMPVTGQHRYDHIAGLQCGLDGGRLKVIDVLGQVADGFLCLFNCPVPDRERLASLDQFAQTGDGRKACTAPVNCHESPPCKFHLLSCLYHRIDGKSKMVEC